MSLQPKQFWFHRSKGDMQPGDRVQSANLRGAGPYMHAYVDWKGPGGTNRGDWVYAAATEHEAEQWAPPWFPGGRKGVGLGRPTTYEVEPAPGRETHIEQGHSRVPAVDHLMTRDEMVVQRRIDIPLPRWDEEGVQGTLPPVDWTEFGATNAKHLPLSSDTALMREDVERAVQPTPGDEARRYESRWERAGQGRLDL